MKISKGQKRFIKMTPKQLDNELDKLPYIWMKPIMYQSIKEVRPEYLPKHVREKKGE